MFDYMSLNEEVAVSSVNELVKSLLDMEDSGSITIEDTDECLYYLKRIGEITGLEVDFSMFVDDEQETTKS